MTRIRLIVTGDVEELALAPSLNRIFPSVQFSVAHKKGFTSSHALKEPQLEGSKALDIVTEMIAAGDVGIRPGEPPHDYAVAIDDLELMNAHQAHMVLKHVKHAVDLKLDHLVREDVASTTVHPKGLSKKWHRLETDAGRRRYLCDRCSFHLLSPMVEALFFGERRESGWPALARAGAKATHPPSFDPAKTDIEAFVTDDATYNGAPDGWIPSGQTHAARWARLKNKLIEDGAHKGKTWREMHPKNYLNFLCDPTGVVRRAYKEREGGKQALETLDWQAVLAVHPHARMARAFLDDVAEMAGVSLQWLDGERHPLTMRKHGGVLRNLV